MSDVSAVLYGTVAEIEYIYVVFSDHFFCLAPTFRENYVIAEKHSTDHVI